MVLVIKDLLHDKWRSIITIINLAVIIIGYQVLEVISDTLAGYGRQDSLTENLVFFEKNTIDPMDSRLSLADSISIRDEVSIQLERLIPVIYRHLKIEDFILQVRAVDVKEMPTTMKLDLLEGVWPIAPASVVVDENVARLLNWNSGSKVNIYGSELKIVGLVRGNNLNANSVWMNFDTGKAVFHDGKFYQALYAVLPVGQDPEITWQGLESDPVLSGRFDIYLENSIDDGIQQSIHNFVILGNIITTLSLLTVTLGVLFLTITSLVERQRDIHLLEILGFTRKKIRLVLCVRMLILLLASYAFGSLLTAVFLRYHQMYHAIALVDLNQTLHLSSPTFWKGLLLALVFGLAGVVLSTSKRYFSHSRHTERG